MIKTINILSINNYTITCKFNTNEVKTIDMINIINNSNKFVNKQLLLDPEFFKQVKIGQFGQLYWQNAAYFKDETGTLIACEYDVSPEFLYHNSISNS